MTTATHFQTAHQRGFVAGLKNKPVLDCPYPDVRTRQGHVTFSRAYRTYWFDGWNAGRDERDRRNREFEDKLIANAHSPKTIEELKQMDCCLLGERNDPD